MKGNKITEKDDKNILFSGVITLGGWTMMPDGRIYEYVYCAKWEIRTDKQFPVDGFRSSEKWQLFGIVNDKIKCIIPGCQVNGWVFCGANPNSSNCYTIN